MKLRTVGKIGAFLSVVLFCVGVMVYGFVRVYGVEEGKDVNLLSLVPADCIGLLETDNLDLLASRMPQTAYADKFDSVRTAGILPIIFDDLVSYSGGNTHGVGNCMGRLMVSFHCISDEKAMVAYFTTSRSGTKMFSEMLQRKGIGFRPKTEVYRGRKLVVFPVRDGDFLTTYSGPGFVAVSYQKSLIEKVIDTEKGERSLAKDALFGEVYHDKSANFVTLYTRGVAFPFLSDGHQSGWSEFNMHLNSEMFYMSGSIHVPDSCLTAVQDRLAQVHPQETDSVLILAGTESIDSCIYRKNKLVTRSIFDECVVNLSDDAIYVMVADMDKVIQYPESYKALLPTFVADHFYLFRSFVFSMQLNKTDGAYSHLLIFTYKE